MKPLSETHPTLYNCPGLMYKHLSLDSIESIQSCTVDRERVQSVIHGWGSYIPKEKLESLSPEEYQSICQVIVAIAKELE